MEKKYHFIGIGGIGMSGLANILIEKDAMISGSDLTTNSNTLSLSQKGATIHIGHKTEHISAQDIVVYSSGVSKQNPEYLAALNMKCLILHRSQLLAQLMEGYSTIAITGSHGKTSTSSLLTTVLLQAGVDPTFAIGGMLGKENGRLGKGKYFIAEADESDGTLLNYHPEGAIITNIDAEHIEHFGTIEALHNVFQKFIGQVSSSDLLFYCGDDPNLVEISNGKGVSYGFKSTCELQISNFRQSGWKIVYDLKFKGKAYLDVEVALLGEHQARNSAAVFGLSLTLGIDEQVIRTALQSFPGVGRRCEKKGEVNQILMFDDYAHHPTEIEATLKAMREASDDRRLVVLFQPHRFKRTEYHLKNFGKVFELADLLFVTDIYGAGEEAIEGITAQTIISEIQKQSTVPVRYLSKENWVSTLHEELQPHDLFLTMGAGDVTSVHKDLQKDFPSKKIRVGLLFGGRSCEHEISVKSCRFVFESLDRAIYDVQLFAIDKKGNWICGKEAESVLANKDAVPLSRTSLFSTDIIDALKSCDLFFPMLHGTFGEDGTIQGFFEMIGKPYVGPDYCSAALTINKVLTKKLVALGGVSTPSFLYFGHLEWHRNQKNILQEIFTTLKLPLYVKPVHLGSSVGISKVTEKKDLAEAIQIAFRYDTEVMIEEGKENCRELEFAVIGNDGGGHVDVPNPGEKFANGAFVDYNKKYGSQPVQTTTLPELDPEILKKGKELALKAYRSVGCNGMTRVDFLLDPEGKWWLFEMNGIPGMQKLSLFPKIWNREGLVPSQLMNRLIILALHRGRARSRHIAPV